MLKKILKSCFVLIIIFLGLIFLTNTITYNSIDLEAAETKTSKEWIKIAEEYKSSYRSVAIEAYERAVKVSKDKKEKARAIYEIAFLYYELKQPEKANEIIKEEISKGTEHIGVYSLLVGVYLDLNEPYFEIMRLEKRAKEKINNSTGYTQEEINQVYYMLYKNLCVAVLINFNGTGDPEDFIKFGTLGKSYIDDNIKDIYPKWWLPYYNISLGVMLKEKKEMYKESIDTLKWLYYDQKIEDSNIINILGETYRLAGKHEEAKKYYLKAIDMGNRYAENNYKKFYGKNSNN